MQVRKATVAPRAGACLLNARVVCMAGAAEGAGEQADLWVPECMVQLPHVEAAARAAAGQPGVAVSSAYDDHRPRTPPPDLPSLLLDSRITYLGMPVRSERTKPRWHACSQQAYQAAALRLHRCRGLLCCPARPSQNRAQSCCTRSHAGGAGQAV